MRIRKLVAGLTLALACTTVPALAAADTAGAQTFVEREHGNLKKLVESNASNDKIRQSIDAMVDYDEFARRSLGNPCPPGDSKTCTNHWDSLGQSQRDEIKGLLQKLIEKNYRRNLKKTKDYDVTYRGAKEQGDNLAKVRTEAKKKGDNRDAWRVDYVIRSQGDGYKVIDIVTEGSSMTTSYYRQFTKELGKDNAGYSKLVKKLQDKIAEKEKEGDSK